MKKIISVGLIFAMTAALVGCGKKNEYGINPDDYVTLGDYKNMTVDVNYYDFTEEEVQQYARQNLDYFVSSYDLYDYEPIKNKTVVSENDIVNIDYIGTLDGVAFDGGTAEGAHLKIGSDSYIDGFEDGLIGVAVGDTVDLNLTFPDDFSSEDLSGKDVVFSVIVNSIDEQKEPEYNQEFFINYYGINDVTDFDGFVELVRSSIEKEKETSNQNVLSNAIWTKVTEMCEVSELPQKMIDQKKADIDAELKAYEEENEIDTETALSYLGYESTESYEEFKQESAESAVHDELIYQAIANAEDIDISEDAITALAKDNYEEYGYSSADEMLTELDGASGSYMKSYLRLNMVVDALKKYATVNELETVSLLEMYLY